MTRKKIRIFSVSFAVPDFCWSLIIVQVSDRSVQFSDTDLFKSVQTLVILRIR